MRTFRIVLGCIFAIWFLLAGGAGAQVITEFSANGYPYGITAGPDGNLWFTERSGNRIGRITPAGVVTEFSAGITGCGSRYRLPAGPVGITAGPDGNLWFTEYYCRRIGRITPQGVVTEFSAGITGLLPSSPTGITAGPDGNLWFAEGSRIGRITPLGVVTEFGAGITAGAHGITAGPDGNLWFTEQSANRIGRITPAGVVTEFSAGITAGAGPHSITAGPDGNLWFTEFYGYRIGRITPAGVVTEFSAGITGSVGPYGITAGPDGNLWFAEFDANRIGRITPAGVVTEFSAAWNPAGITAGPDSSLWFTEPGVNQIGRITTTSAAITTTTIVSSVNPSIVGQAITFTASVAGNFPTGTVQFMDGGTNLGSPVTLSGGGVAQIITSTLTEGTYSIVAKYSGDANNAASQSAPLSQVVNGIGGGTSINVALAANGGVASASSSFSSAYPVSAVNDGDRAGVNFSNGGVWADATLASFPDWVQIIFNGSKTIDHVIVYSVQDNAFSPVAPSDTLTFSSGQRGVTGFEVQAWNGAAWVSLGSVSGNNLVKRSLAFPATTTSKIRVVINSASNGRYSMLAEIEAWTTGGAAPPPPTTTTIVSSVNPSLVGQAVTFTASVAGNFPTGTVQFRDGGTNLGSPVTLSGGGVAQLITSTLTQGTHSIVAKYSGDANNAASQSDPLSQVVNGIGGGTSINVALAANGGVASASSSFSSAYPVSAVNDGDRAGVNFSNGGVWADATLASFPDWVQIAFNGSKTIDHVIVYSVQDNASSPVEPSDTLTFSSGQRGVTGFEVQAWNGIAWVSLGSVSGNNLVKRSLSFVATTTSKIRVVINSASNDRYSLLTEIEAWTH